jgi:predicted Fe-Mo cluster-binding NifX family protein
MKIAVTSNGASIDSTIDERFGRARYIIIYDTQSKSFETIDNETNVNLAQGAGIQTAGNMAEKKVELILTGRVGPKASEALNRAGIKYIEGVSGTCRSAVEKYSNQ